MNIVKNLLIIGAGATYAEAQELGVTEEQSPPLIKNFISKLWKERFPLSLKKNGLLTEYISIIKQKNSACYNEAKDISDLFIRLEKEGSINIEKFFAFAWKRRNLYPEEYENILYNGIFMALTDMIILYILTNKDIREKYKFIDIEPGSWPFPPLKLSNIIGNYLNDNDAVLNLNYDTFFEIGLKQIGKDFIYLPFHKPDKNKITIIKPHGSFNFFEEKGGNKAWVSPTLFNQSQPNNNSKNYLTFIPPMLGKNFEQHPLSRAIIEAIPFNYPLNLIFWGVGFTESDVNLINMYKKWANMSRKVSFINPDKKVSSNFKKNIGGNVFRYDNVNNFITNKGIEVL